MLIFLSILLRFQIGNSNVNGTEDREKGNVDRLQAE